MKTKIAVLLALFIASTMPQYKLQMAFPDLTFEQPLDFQSPKDGTNRIFVATQGGIIYVFKNDPDITTKKVFLDISDKVISGGEMGLLGLTFHPDFKTNGYFYINYTAPSPLRTIIARYSISKSNPDEANKNSEIIILEVNQPYQNHNAGQLAFGPDGYLYIGFGDGGSAGDPQNNAQNYTSLLGKMLRIDVDIPEATRSYSIPRDNPYFGNTKDMREEIWAGGFRNPWRYSFDPITGNLWVADVGQDLWEEVDIVKKAGNYGWRFMEGFHCYAPANCDSTGLSMPLWEYAHDDSGGHSITGGYVYRGTKMNKLFGKYIYADYVSGRVWALEYDGYHKPKNELLLNSRKNISSFGLDQNHELYICAYDGMIYKFADSNLTEIKLPEKPMEYGLYHNFPNPFNPRTTIIADVKRKGQVIIEIFDGYGKKIETLVNDVLPAGRHKFLWDATNYPSGIYIYQMTAGPVKISRKMVLLK